MADTERSGSLSVDHVMEFVASLTQHRLGLYDRIILEEVVEMSKILSRRNDFKMAQLECANAFYSKMLKDDQGYLTLDDFKRMIPCKNVYHALTHSIRSR